MRKISFLLTLAAALFIVAACAGDNEAGAPPNGKLVLVTGATGTQGGAVAYELLKRGYEVRGLTRNPDSDRAQALAKRGVEMVQGDFDDTASLASAMEGAYGVFAVTDFWEHGFATEVLHGETLVDVASAAGVQHFVFTSVAGADVYTGIPHFESKSKIEEYLAASDLNWSVVRPVSFMDNVKYEKSSILSGVFFDPRDTGKSHQWIAASDIGFFVGEAFDKPDDWYGQALEIAGDSMTLAEFAEELSRTFGINVHHQQITWETYEEQLGEELTLMVRWFDEKGYDVDVKALRARYPNLLTYSQYLQTLDWQ